MTTVIFKVFDREKKQRRCNCQKKNQMPWCFGFPFESFDLFSVAAAAVAQAAGILPSSAANIERRKLAQIVESSLRAEEKVEGGGDQDESDMETEPDSRQQQRQPQQSMSQASASSAAASALSLAPSHVGFPGYSARFITSHKEACRVACFSRDGESLPISCFLWLVATFSLSLLARSFQQCSPHCYICFCSYVPRSSDRDRLCGWRHQAHRRAENQTATRSKRIAEEKEHIDGRGAGKGSEMSHTDRGGRAEPSSLLGIANSFTEWACLLHCTC